MKRAFTLVEVMISAALVSLLLVILSGCFISIRKVSVARTRRLESRLPVIQSLDRLGTDLLSSGTGGVVVGPTLVSVCPKAPVSPDGRPQWSAGLIVWSWQAASRELRVYRMQSDQARAAGFVGGTDDPLAPELSELQTFAAKELPTEEVYPLENCTFFLSKDGLISMNAAARLQGGRPFSLTRLLGFHL